MMDLLITPDLDSEQLRHLFTHPSPMNLTGVSLFAVDASQAQFQSLSDLSESCFVASSFEGSKLDNGHLR
jgi:hypothetical protein